MNTRQFFAGRAIGLLVLIIVGGGLYFFAQQKQKTAQIPASTFEECIAEGNPVMESYPRQCVSKAGKHFTENIGNSLEKAHLIRLTSPLPNAIVASPLQITGEARGYWFFEASFPVELVEKEGEIAHGIATAQSEWMTEDFVPFTATLTFDAQPTMREGTLILRKDNPSGMSDHEDALQIPVRFRE